MLIAYYISNQTCKVKHIEQVSEYSINLDLDFSDKTTITVAEYPSLEEGDMIVIDNSGSKIFTGICDSFSGDTAPYKISLKQMECLFDRKIFVGTESLISSTGIEDFIVSEIQANFIGSGDSLLDKTYMTIKATTHTPLSTTVASNITVTDNIYNLKTFLGNIKQYYSIFLNFTITNGTLAIEVVKDTADEIKLDTNMTDITNLSESYSVTALARLTVLWKIPDTTTTNTVSGSTLSLSSTVVGASEYRNFYLKSDRTITQDIDDEDRISGTSSCIYSEQEDEADMLQDAYNSFASNSYKHSMTMDVLSNSKIYPADELYLGRKIVIKSKTTGEVTSTMISKVSKSNDKVVSLTLGSLAITLIDKIRRL